MRSREIRLRHAFRRIVTLALAAAPCAAACHAATDTEPHDAATGHEPDAAALGTDAADASDAPDVETSDAASCALDWLDATDYEDGDACSSFRLLPPAASRTARRPVSAASRSSAPARTPATEAVSSITASSRPSPATTGG